MSGPDRRRREAVLYEVALSRLRAQRRIARRAAAMRAAAALRIAASAMQSSRSTP